MSKPGHHGAAYVLLGALLAVDVAVFLLQKGASTAEGDGAIDVLRHAASSPLLWVALGLAPVQLWLWTRVLRNSEIAWAYALTSLAYPLTMVAASLLYRERYEWQVWLGAALITTGAGVLGPPQTKAQAHDADAARAEPEPAS